jgi:MFS family permease
VLIIGRAIQGVGTGGLNMILDIILSDLVPLRDRGVYIAITLVVLTIGTSMGPFIGGVLVEKTSWRWVFYINLSFGGVSFIVLFGFLQVGSVKETSWRNKLSRIDFVGNAILMASTSTFLYALTYGGSRYPWSSARVTLTLVFGFSGLAAFVLLEHLGWAREPVIPLQLFRNRTAAVVFVNTFLSAVLLYWAIFYLSVYFQAVFGLQSYTRRRADAPSCPRRSAWCRNICDDTLQTRSLQILARHRLCNSHDRTRSFQYT